MAVKQKDSSAQKLVEYITKKALDGFGPLCSAKDLALQYKIDRGYDSNDDRVDSLINWETTKNFTSGFITGLGGLITLPVSIPSGFGASWIIQARMAGAIACIYGHNLNDDRVKTMVLVCLLGDAGKEVLKSAGIRFGGKLAAKGISKIPGRVLIEINKRIGFRLITKAGEKGIINLTKLIPGLGGIIGGAVDGVACRTVGRAAKSVFSTRYKRRTRSKKESTKKLLPVSQSPRRYGDLNRKRQHRIATKALPDR